MAAVNITGIGNYTGSDDKTYRIVPAKSAAPTLANSTKDILTVTWKKNAKASGYKIQCVAGSITKTVTVKGNAIMKKVLAFTKGKTYKVSVRAYKTVSGVNYIQAPEARLRISRSQNKTQ